MKFSIAKRDLLEIIKHVSDTVEKKSTIPILGNIYLAAANNRLTIRATDLDIMLENSVACEVTEDGATTVPAKMFKEIVEKCSADTEIKVEQKTEGGQLQVKYGRSKFSLQSLPISDFPEFATRDIAHTFSVPVADILSLFKGAEFCISSEETRYYLNGIFFHHIGEADVTKLCAVATDGHRLAKITCEAPEGADKFGNDNNRSGIILPRKTTRLLQQIIKGGNHESIGMQVNDSKVVFTVGTAILSSKIVDGQFPDYMRVIPSKNEKIITADRVALMDGVDRLAILTTDNLAIKMSFASGTLTISATNAEAGAATEEIDIEYEGESIDIGFNSKFMVEILKGIEGDKVQVALSDPGSPAMISAVGDTNAIYVAMPMRVQ